jgi:hypothetical protein
VAAPLLAGALVALLVAAGGGYKWWAAGAEERERAAAREAFLTAVAEQVEKVDMSLAQQTAQRDAALVAAGDEACDGLDAGLSVTQVGLEGSPDLAAALAAPMTVGEAADIIVDSLAQAILTAAVVVEAARHLCPEHRDQLADD